MTSGGVPTTMKALLISDDGSGVTFKDHPVPKISDDEILVKTVALSLNPTDYKHVDTGVGKPGTVLGCDFSGIVVQIGNDVNTVGIGDHVAGFVHGGAWPEEGAFAEYLRTPAELVWVVPGNTLTHEQAATFGVAFLTAAQALFHPKRLGLEEPPRKTPNLKDEWVLVYGGSSAVGQSAIQLLNFADYRVVTTASPKNFALTKSMGADEVFDYKDPEVVSKIKKATRDTIKNALDTIAFKECQRIAAESLCPSGGKVIVLLTPQPDATDRKDVEIQHTLLYTALGREFDFGDQHYPASKEDRVQLVNFLKKLPKFVQGGYVKPLPIKIIEGGMNGIPDALQYMREGKVSGEKLVCIV